MGTLRRRCVTVPQPSELRFGVVRAVGRCIAVLDGGPRRARERGRFGGFCSPFSQWEMQLGRRRRNVPDSYAKTSQHFHSANVSLESSIRGLSGDIFSYKIKFGVYEKLEKSNDCSIKTQMHAAKCCYPRCDDGRCSR